MLTVLQKQREIKKASLEILNFTRSLLIILYKLTRETNETKFEWIKRGGPQPEVG